MQEDPNLYSWVLYSMSYVPPPYHKEHEIVYFNHINQHRHQNKHTPSWCCQITSTSRFYLIYFASLVHYVGSKPLSSDAHRTCYLVISVDNVASLRPSSQRGSINVTKEALLLVVVVGLSGSDGDGGGCWGAGCLVVVTGGWKWWLLPGCSGCCWDVWWCWW